MRVRALAAAALVLLAPAAASAQGDSETLRDAKTLFFDREYARAREAWQAVRSSGTGAEASAALYWIARCSERLGESERALSEYRAYLESGHTEATLREEAATSRVALATRLYKAGVTRHLHVVEDALGDRNKTVRYFAALQLSSLEPEVGRPAIPVLREILRAETDEDLVERAKLALLRLDRQALADAAPVLAPSGRGAGWIHIRIWEKGSDKPQVSVNLPVALAEMVFKSLPDDARNELRRKGYDADTLWTRLKKAGKAEILTIEGDDGERIQVWIE
jgi:hypothetical protein